MEVSYYKRNKEKVLAQQRAYRKANPEKRRSIKRRYYANNKELHALWVKTYEENNLEKVKVRRLAKHARRRAAKHNALPAWQDPSELVAFYTFRPDGYHVDHIIPLQNDLVCGLHVLHNLQYLPAANNLSKNNNFQPYIEIKATGQRTYA